MSRSEQESKSIPVKAEIAQTELENEHLSLLSHFWIFCKTRRVWQINFLMHDDQDRTQSPDHLNWFIHLNEMNLFIFCNLELHNIHRSMWKLLIYLHTFKAHNHINNICAWSSRGIVYIHTDKKKTKVVYKIEKRKGEKNCNAHTERSTFLNLS